MDTMTIDDAVFRKETIMAVCPCCFELGICRSEQELEYGGHKPYNGSVSHFYTCRMGHESNLFELYDYNVRGRESGNEHKGGLLFANT